MKGDYFKENCPVIQRTADGINVGRCWMHIKANRCPYHGDVSEAVKRYIETGKLTDENDLRRRVAEQG